MPRKKKNTGKKRAIDKEKLIPEITTEEKDNYSTSQSPTSKSFWSIKTIILIVILLAFIFFWKFKNMLIVAMVNGQPISRWQLTDQLVKRFGDQMLESIINERLILAAIRQKGVFITANEIDARVKEVEKRLEGKLTLDDALKAQGMSKEDFKRQIEIQLSIDKLFDKEASVSSKEIDDYVTKNSSAYKNATDPAAVKEEVRNMLRQQKIADLFDSWFTEIRKSAKISKFL